MSELINLTPHPIRIYTQEVPSTLTDIDQGLVTIIPPSGEVARLASEEPRGVSCTGSAVRYENAEFGSAHIQLDRVVFTTVYGLPAPRKDPRAAVLTARPRTAETRQIQDNSARRLDIPIQRTVSPRPQEGLQVLDYRLSSAYEDVSRVALGKHELDHDVRLRAASLLHTLYRAGWAEGMPDDPDQWPGGNPAGFVVGLIVHAGAPVPVEVSCGASSSWAHREVAAEAQAALDVQRQYLEPEEIAKKEREISDLLEWADQMVVDDDGFPEPDELEEYDAGLR